MTPEIVQLGQVASIGLPWVVFVVVEIFRELPSSSIRSYRRFVIFGCAHGLILWVVFVWSHGHGAIPETWTELAISLTIFSIGALAVLSAFTLAYLATAFVLWHLRRLLRSQ